MKTVVVAGTGFIGQVHVEALRRLGNVRVQGVLGSSREKSEAVAQRWGLARAYGDLREVLDDRDVDAVHIATPNREHLPMARAALESGKHVMCEKPLAMSSRESGELAALARSRPRQAAGVNYNVRFYPIALQMRELVRSGELGTIRAVRGAYEQDWLLLESDWNWRLLPEEGGELRAIGDIGTHWMDLAGFATGLEVESLLADLATFVPVRRRPRTALATFEGKLAVPPGEKNSGEKNAENDPVEIRTEDWGAVLFRYAGGARGTMNVSQVTAGRKNRLTLEIAGSRGALAWDSERPEELWIGSRERPNSLLLKDPSLLSGEARAFAGLPGGHAEGFADSFRGLYAAFYGHIERGDFDAPRPYPTFEDGHREAILCEAILESHRARRWVDVPRGT